AAAPACPARPTGDPQGDLLDLSATRVGTHPPARAGPGGRGAVCLGAGALGGECPPVARAPPRRPAPAARPVGRQRGRRCPLRPKRGRQAALYLLHLSGDVRLGRDVPPRLSPRAAAHGGGGGDRVERCWCLVERTAALAGGVRAAPGAVGLSRADGGS